MEDPLIDDNISFAYNISHISGKLPRIVFSMLEEYIYNSPLYNPYKEDNSMLIWAIYRNRQKSNTVKSQGRGVVEARRTKLTAEVPTGSAEYYKDQGTLDFDNRIPTWDLNMEELQVLYDHARFVRHFDWYKTDFLCVKTKFKRRLPWLYPYNGNKYLLKIAIKHFAHVIIYLTF